ncbi:hypothetical protein MTO96_041143 [Rhipicephalus appendiculatus]
MTSLRFPFDYNLTGTANLQSVSQFVLSDMHTEQREYHLIVSALLPAASEEASDLLSGPPSSTKYSNLEATLLERTTV